MPYDIVHVIYSDYSTDCTFQNGLFKVANPCTNMCFHMKYRCDFFGYFMCN